MSTPPIDEVAIEMMAQFRADSARAERARRDAQAQPCPVCRGKGMDLRHPLAQRLWGGNCWGCAGWGGVVPHQRGLRSPFGRHPNRSRKQEVHA